MTRINDAQGRQIDLRQSFLESGFFGDGSDGSVTFDGTSTVLGLVPSSSTYTLNRSIFCVDLTVNSGATIITAGYKIFCAGTLINNGTISNAGKVGGNGGNGGGAGGAAGAAGAALASNELGGSSAGGAGGLS